jgi:transcriptional regulator with XRE-family HTH domain
MAKKISFEVTVDQQMKAIGERVRELRRLKNQNYEVWAYLNGVNKVSLNRIERGENVTTKMLLQILQKLGVSAKDFFSDIR